MRYLLVITKKIASNQLKELSEHYSIIHLGKAHLKKSINQIGSAELFVLNLNFGVIHQPSKSLELKWLNEQDLSQFQVVYIYNKPKYQKTLACANIYLKSLPLVIGKTLDKVLALSQRMRSGSVSLSLTSEDLKIINEESHEVQVSDIIKAFEDYAKLKIDYEVLQSKCAKLEHLLEEVKEPPPPERKAKLQNDEITDLKDICSKLSNCEEKSKPQKPVKSIKHIPKGIQLIKDGIIIDTLIWSNRSQQRSQQKVALRWVRE